ncbi:MAG: hypothetical protein HY927_07710 [Elusimicrobia bacterium]|nr:hypothetical protein [Elusimicrobiota bacterium]
MRGATSVLVAAALTASTAVAAGLVPLAAVPGAAPEGRLGSPGAAGGVGDLPRVDFDAVGRGFRDFLGEVAASCMMRGAAGPEVDLATIVNAGRASWKIVENNAVLPDAGQRFAAALPEGLRDWTGLCQWSGAEADRFEFEVKDVVGLPAARVAYSVVRTTGGRYAGKGRFLTGVSVQPTTVEVRAGYELSMAAKVLAVSNVGTLADPVAAIVLAVQWRAKGLAGEQRGGSAFIVRGDGGFTRIQGW